MLAMRGWRGVVTGLLTLIVFETFVASKGGPGHFSGILDTATGWLSRTLDPTVPAITAKVKQSPGAQGGGVLGGGPGSVGGVPSQCVDPLGCISLASFTTPAGAGNDAVSSWIASLMTDTGASSSSSSPSTLPPTTGFPSTPPGPGASSGTFNPATAV